MNTENLLMLRTAGELYQQYYFGDQIDNDSVHQQFKEHLTNNLEEIVQNFADSDTEHLIHDTPEVMLSIILCLAAEKVNLPGHSNEAFDTLMIALTDEQLGFFLKNYYVLLDEKPRKNVLSRMAERKDGQPVEWLTVLYPTNPYQTR